MNPHQQQAERLVNLRKEACEITARIYKCGFDNKEQRLAAVEEIIVLLKARDERDELKKETCECRWDNTGGQTIECKSHAKLRAELERVKGEAETWASRASQYVSDEQKYGTHKELSDQLAALMGVARAMQNIANLKDAPDIDATGDWQKGLHCGVEDRNCRNRYDGADYGHTVGVEKGLEWAKNEATAALTALREKFPDLLK